MTVPAPADAPSRPIIVLRLAKLVAMALAELEVTDNQYRVLCFVAEGDIDLQEMCTRLVMKPPNLSVLIDGLVERGLLERQRRVDDGRRVALVLTPSGRDAVAQATRRAEDALAGLAVLGEGSASYRLAGLDSWSTTVESAALMLRREAAEHPAVAPPVSTANRRHARRSRASVEKGSIKR